MRNILEELNSETGILGSMVITPDGIMVAAALGADLEEDSVAAFAASVLMSAKRGLSRLNVSTELRSCTLAGERGKIVFHDMEKSYLVLVTEADTRLDTHAEAVDHAISKILNRRVA